VVLLGAALLGCGATHGGRTEATRGTSSPAATLAAEIDRAQRTIDDPSAPPSDLREAARAEQLAFRELADRRPLRHATLARLSPGARSAATAALRAADALAKITPAERRFPRWRIVAPPPAKRLLGYFQAAAAAYRVPWRYLAAVELVETRMGRIRGLSPAGAQGPMQFEPATWAEYGHGSIDSQHDSIMAAARFLAANGGYRHIGRALFHYNPSRSYVVAVESYAREMQRDTRAFYGYYDWEVLYRTKRGTFLLPLGYPRARPERLAG
jgi:membrane-bound lytic murein transglycosylase B